MSNFVFRLIGEDLSTLSVEKNTLQKLSSSAVLFQRLEIRPRTDSNTEPLYTQAEIEKFSREEAQTVQT